MKRIVAIDFGIKRIGIAISDNGQTIAFPLATVSGGNNAVLNIKNALKEKLPDVERILVGFPVLLSGKEGDMAILVKKFAQTLEEAFALPVELIDERFTSRLADQHLREIHLNRKERTAKLDTAAAAILLQAYLDGLK
ncbi:MAG TPA: Holliday junction resolvase RuvX [Chlamydiales bacterium]|nr:Holliday junction resolvase RuvX [Chlamydiales bacterium]